METTGVISPLDSSGSSFCRTATSSVVGGAWRLWDSCTVANLGDAQGSESKIRVEFASSDSSRMEASISRSHRIPQESQTPVDSLYCYGRVVDLWWCGKLPQSDAEDISRGGYHPTTHKQQSFIREEVWVASSSTPDWTHVSVAVWRIFRSGKLVCGRKGGAR